MISKNAFRYIKHLCAICCAVLFLCGTASGTTMHVLDLENDTYEWFEYDLPDEVDQTWLPLREATTRLPCTVSWMADEKKLYFSSDPMLHRWPALAAEVIPTDAQTLSVKELQIVGGVTYCSPWFLSNRMPAVSFVHDGELWYLQSDYEFESYIRSALFMLQMIAPTEYLFIMNNLPGGVQVAPVEDAPITTARAFVYPHSKKPICYIVDTSMYGAELASVIAHEAWHVYEAKGGINTGELGANMFRQYVYDLLLVETRVHTGFSE